MAKKAKIVTTPFYAPPKLEAEQYVKISGTLENPDEVRAHQNWVSFMDDSGTYLIHKSYPGKVFAFKLLIPASMEASYRLAISLVSNADVLPKDIKIAYLRDIRKFVAAYTSNPKTKPVVFIDKAKNLAALYNRSYHLVVADIELEMKIVYGNVP